MGTVKNVVNAAFSTTSTNMAKEYKLKDITSLNLSEGEKKEVEVEGIKDGKVLLLKSQGKFHATSPNCTHYGAPLKGGVLSSDGRLTCPWHGGKFPHPLHGKPGLTRCSLFQGRVRRCRRRSST